MIGVTRNSLSWIFVTVGKFCALVDGRKADGRFRQLKTGLHFMASSLAFAPKLSPVVIVAIGTLEGKATHQKKMTIRRFGYLLGWGIADSVAEFCTAVRTHTRSKFSPSCCVLRKKSWQDKLLISFGRYDTAGRSQKCSGGPE